MAKFEQFSGQLTDKGKYYVFDGETGYVLRYDSLENAKDMARTFAGELAEDAKDYNGNTGLFADRPSVFVVKLEAVY